MSALSLDPVDVLSAIIAESSATMSAAPIARERLAG